MSLLLPLRALAEEKGIVRAWPAPVVAVAFAGRHFGFGLGDGTVRLIDIEAPDSVVTAPAHGGVVLALCPDVAGGFLSGGDDGRLCRIDPGGAVSEIATVPGRWIAAVDAAPATGRRLCAAGRDVLVFDAEGGEVTRLQGPAVIDGAAFDPRGRRVAAAHYGGVTVWSPRKRGWPSRLYAWQGAHLGVTWHPRSRFIVSALQEKALHAWRLSDGVHMQMPGYPAKPRSMAWADGGRALVTSGSEGVVSWRFTGRDGPMGGTASEAGWARGTPITRVAAHPLLPVVAAGAKDGFVALMPLDGNGYVPVLRPYGAAIEALAFSADGRWLAAGDAGGRAALVDLQP
ncbi:WD40 repeat protein [Inquilinus ginsengisoli]|uniref:WD40 repeat protein n=1 Tax=Inquilinus ginsengisoli TaxID=363840 RepID=A0ABU1JM60_9PROT|nr:WD40 repeat domain-containing protein [Inquilinus ginsengisoli]MDR6289701.1 WD40 repeat protein [Inquilinus ginsengisoli]